jgi:hypothetical protein
MCDYFINILQGFCHRKKVTTESSNGFSLPNLSVAAICCGTFTALLVFQAFHFHFSNLICCLFEHPIGRIWNQGLEDLAQLESLPVMMALLLLLLLLQVLTLPYGLEPLGNYTCFLRLKATLAACHYASTGQRVDKLYIYIYIYIYNSL